MKKIIILIVVPIVAVSIFLLYKNIDANKKNQDLSSKDLPINNKYEDIKITENNIDVNLEDGIDVQQFMRTNSQGRVDVGVLFTNLIEDNKDYIVFELMLNTHSVDLDEVDYAKLSRVTNDSGLIIDEGIIWEKDGGSGHHIFGYIKVPKKYKEKSIIEDTTKFIELEINGLDGVESRKFIWEEDALKYLKNE
ncbi:hypothetical protein R9X47_06990 [Wukongibacter baidiensis]|uniref:hypothetical protein n=1 Tax=Wukongibacter baidiensis TaxID=1723361 RepID=UPI003D7FDA04